VGNFVVTTATRKLVFNDQRALQLVLGTPGESKRVVGELERATGVALHVRGTEVTLDGETDKFDLVERLLKQMFQLARGGRPMMPTDVVRGIEILEQDPEAELTGVYDDVILTKNSGKTIAPRSLAQKRYVDAMRRNTLVFGVGPAGTGKTFLAVAMAVRRLADKQVRRIILSRPAVEAGESLGFLPGELDQKYEPFIMPFRAVLEERLGGGMVDFLLKNGRLEAAPLAYMRGRTFTNAFIILDEAQNTTPRQMKLFLSRIGENCKIVVDGDPNQQDISGKNGLVDAVERLSWIPSVKVVEFTRDHIVRSGLVAEIVGAYEAPVSSRSNLEAI
jgi:phosphate starvation-inducible PhoH-like protein